MFESVKKIENKNQEYNFSTEKSIILVMQFMVDGYLKRKNQPTMKEILNSDGIEDKAGVIYNYHIAFLQSMIAEELQLVNVNLADEVNKTGEQYELGKLSKYEASYLDNKISNVASILDVVRERLNK